MPFDALTYESPALSTADGLRMVRCKLADPKAWTRGAFARNKDYKQVSYTAESAIKWCLVGAINALWHSQLEVLGFNVHQAVAKEIRGDIVAWNDHKSRTHHDVLALLDRAIAKAEEKARAAKAEAQCTLPLVLA
jgi:hypothetical protein